MFVGQDAEGQVGIFEQAFAPGEDTSATRRLVVPSAQGRLTESFDLSPDGSWITVSYGNHSRTVWLPGVEPVRRRRP